MRMSAGTQWCDGIQGAWLEADCFWSGSLLSPSPETKAVLTTPWGHQTSWPLSLGPSCSAFSFPSPGRQHTEPKTTGLGERRALRGAPPRPGSPGQGQGQDPQCRRSRAERAGAATARMLRGAAGGVGN